MQSLIRAKEPQGSHGVSASSGVASIYGKGVRKHVQRRRLRIVSAPKGRKIIGSMWVFKVKPDGLFKSRFCAQGLSQVAGTDFGSNYTPACRIPSVRIVLAIAASHDWNVIQLDVQTAFLQSEMKEDLYVKPPVGFEKLDLNHMSVS